MTASPIDTDADPTPTRDTGPSPLPRGPHHLSAEEELVGLQGYPATSVADVVQRSGVSRRTFYELFPNRAELLRSAFEVSAASMLEQVEASFGRSRNGTARLEALMRPLCRAAQERPGALALWSVEIAADSEGRRLRGALMDRYAELIQSCTSAGGEPLVPHSLAVTLAGALHREIDATARDTRTSLSPDLPSRLAHWASCYHPLPAGLELELAQPGGLEGKLLIGGRAPGTLAPRPDSYVPRIGGASSGFRAHANRERILDAVTQITAESGSAALGGQAILERAEVPENFFRAEFKNARGAFMAALELGHMKGQAILERARADAPSWREGVQAAVHALLDFFASEPYFARLAFIDAPFAWPATAHRASEHAAAYARVMFSGAPRQRRPVALAAALSSHALIELVFRAAVNDRLDELPRAGAEATYLALAPFVGVTVAGEAASASS